MRTGGSRTSLRESLLVNIKALLNPLLFSILSFILKESSVWQSSKHPFVLCMLTTISYYWMNGNMTVSESYKTYFNIGMLNTGGLKAWWQFLLNDRHTILIQSSPDHQSLWWINNSMPGFCWYTLYHGGDRNTESSKSQHEWMGITACVFRIGEQYTRASLSLVLLKIKI